MVELEGIWETVGKTDIGLVGVGSERVLGTSGEKPSVGRWQSRDLLFAWSGDAVDREGSVVAPMPPSPSLDGPLRAGCHPTPLLTFAQVVNVNNGVGGWTRAAVGMVDGATPLGTGRYTCYPRRQLGHEREPVPGRQPY